MSLQTYSRICEGPCNPSVAALDAHVASFRKQYEPKDHMPITLPLLDWLRGLRHTPHKMLGTNSAVCTRCGTSRRYGKD